MENVCCLPEALVEIGWKHRNKLCRPNLSAPSSPPKKSTKSNTNNNNNRICKQQQQQQQKVLYRL